MRPLLLLLPLLSLSCIPDRLVPYDYSIEKDNYQAFIEADSVTLSLECLSIEGDYYVFGMEIQNNSSQAISIDLKQLRKYAYYDSYREAHDYKQDQEVTIAMTPKQVTQMFRRKEREAKAAAVFLFIVGAAITSYDAIKDEKDSRKENWTKKDEKKSIKRDMAISAGLVTTDVLTNVAFAGQTIAREELKYLPRELFDSEIISPKQSYFGKIFFSKQGEIQRHHRINCLINNERWSFDFRKANYKEREYLIGR